jgi:hypothetical protein
MGASFYYCVLNISSTSTVCVQVQFCFTVRVSYYQFQVRALHISVGPSVLFDLFLGVTILQFSVQLGDCNLCKKKHKMYNNAKLTI